jgi:hypothetical protein
MRGRHLEVSVLRILMLIGSGTEMTLEFHFMNHDRFKYPQVAKGRELQIVDES